MRIILNKIRETKNFAVYEEDGNSMNKLYLPKSLPDTITFELVKE
jgi:hypothetical protein